jgi:hypothetical protein
MFISSSSEKRFRGTLHNIGAGISLKAPAGPKYTPVPLADAFHTIVPPALSSRLVLPEFEVLLEALKSVFSIFEKTDGIFA